MLKRVLDLSKWESDASSLLMRKEQEPQVGSGAPTSTWTRTPSVSVFSADDLSQIIFSKFF